MTGRLSAVIPKFGGKFWPYLLETSKKAVLEVFGIKYVISILFYSYIGGNADGETGRRRI